MTDRSYTILYAEDVPHYCPIAITAATDEAAIEAAKALRSDHPGLYLEPDWAGAFGRRIVHIESPNGRIIAEGMTLDDNR